MQNSKHSIIVNNAKEFLGKINNVLDIYCKTFPEVDYVEILFNDRGKTNYNISINLLSFISEKYGKKEYNEESKQYFNSVKDLHRVSKSLLEDKNLARIVMPKQFEFFVDFINSMETIKKERLFEY